MNGHNLCHLLANDSEQKHNNMYVYVYLREKGNVAQWVKLSEWHMGVNYTTLVTFLCA